MNQPWGLSGPQFLAGYAGALVLSVVLGALIRRVLRRSPQSPQQDGGPYDLYTLAAVAGGADRVVETAVHGLVGADALRVSRNHRITATGTAGADPVQQWVLDSCRTLKGLDLARLRSLARGSQAVDAVLADATARGLLLPKARRRWLRLTALLPAAVLAVGIARLVNGVQLGRPVGFLVLLLVATVPVLLVVATRVPRTTSAGRQVLTAQQRAWRAAARSAAVPAPATTGTTIADSDLLLPGALTGVALLGAAAVTDDALRSSLYGLTGASGSSGSSGSWSSSCSGSVSSCSSSSCSSSSCSSSSCGGGGCGG